MDLLTGVSVLVTSLLPTGEGETVGFSFTTVYLLVLVLDLPTPLEVLI